MTKIFFDTEFDERGSNAPIKLISIGLVDLDGREYYAESAEYDTSTAHEWLQENVVPHLRGGVYRKPREQIATEVSMFCLREYRPEIWAYFGAYDWVLFCQLFESFQNMPSHLPRHCMELKQLMTTLGVHKEQLPKQEGTLHDALEDAKWNREVWKALKRIEEARKIQYE